MAEILSFPGKPSLVRTPPSPIVDAACNAAAATGSLCEATRLLREGCDEDAAGRMLDQTDTLECLLTAARHTIVLTGNHHRDRQLAEAIALWLSENRREAN